MKNEERILDYSDLNIVYITGFYDIPLSGLHLENGRHFLFENLDYDIPNYKVTPLSKCQEVKALINKLRFEMCIGTHWSSNDWADSHCYSDLPRWLRKIRRFLFFYL